MCGIVAFIGEKDCAPVLVAGLRRLEYRGYDSAGLAVQTGRGIETVRAVGKLARLAEALERTPLHGTTGIGHTRWATHGAPSERNAHPHTSGPIAVVHNGIIENHTALRHELEKCGRRFSSDTDTEIIAHLVAEALDAGAPSLTSAVRIALSRVRGAYAIAVLSHDEPDTIVVAKHDSPLVVGTSEDGTTALAASDVPAILGQARDVIFLEDGDMAILRKGEITIRRIDTGTTIKREAKRVDWSIEEAEKSGFSHFMLKEIHEQPRAVEQTLRGRVDRGQGEVAFEDIGIDGESARKISRVYFVACGTSAHAAMVARYWIEQLARVPCVVEIASEVRYREPVLGPGDLVIAVSQSGETADTLAAVKAARAAGAKILALTNVQGSAIARAAHGALYTHAGPEIGVASTKCFTTQLVAMLLFAVWLGRQREVLSTDRSRAILEALHRVPGQMKELVGESDRVEQIARAIVKDARDVLFLGRGTQFPIALEGALKLKEVSYLHAEGYAAGEMKHGPIALIDENVPVVVACPKDVHREKTLSNVQEVMARGARVITIATVGDTEAAGLSEGVMFVPEADETVLPLLTIVPMQLLAFHVAVANGKDVDQPRNLAKTVTVE